MGEYAIALSMAREYPPYLVPHLKDGKRYCPGVLWPVVREGSMADFTCSECGAVVRAVPFGEMPETIGTLVARGNNVAFVCTRCREKNIFRGHSEMFAFICRYCGKEVASGEP